MSHEPPWIFGLFMVLDVPALEGARITCTLTVTRKGSRFARNLDKKILLDSRIVLDFRGNLELEY